MSEMVLFDHATVKVPGGKMFTLTGEIPLPPGGVILLVGENGSGKTLTLSSVAAACGRRELGFVKQLSDFEIVNCEISDLGLVRQEPLENFFSRIAADEFVLPLLKPGIERASREERLGQVLSAVGVNINLLSKRLSHLSSGTIQQLALYASIASSPRLLLLDEAFSRMDLNKAASASKDILTYCSKHKATAMIATHEIRDLAPFLAEATELRVIVVERFENEVFLREETEPYLKMRDKRTSSLPKLGVHFLTLSSVADSRPRRPVINGDCEILGGRSNERVAWLSDFSLFKGINLIVGANASGKTTFGRLLAGQIPCDPLFKSRYQLWATGDVLWQKEQPLSTLARRGESVFVPSDPDHWLAHESVQAELEGLTDGSAALDTARIASDLGISLSSPLDELSYGQRKCVSLLSLPPGLSLVVLDEPFADLSDATSVIIGNWIRQRVQAKEWICVAISTNRPRSSADCLGGALP